MSKIPKPCSDAGVGYQRFNDLADNIDALKAELELEHTPMVADSAETFTHGDVNYGTPPFGYTTQDPIGSAAGVHEHPLIPRGTAYAAQFLLASGLTETRISFGAGALQSMQVLDTGRFFFPMLGFGKVWGKVTPVGLAVGESHIARVQPAEDTSGQTGLMVTMFERGVSANADPAIIYSPSGTFYGRVADRGFFLVAYGRR